MTTTAEELEAPTEEIITLQYTLNPTKEQLQALHSHAGAARYTYNWALNYVYENWDAVKTGTQTEYVKTTLPALRRAWNATKEDHAPWWKENSKAAYDTGLTNAQDAYRRYHNGQNQPPKYKTRHRDVPSITFTTNTRRLEDTKRHFTLSGIGTIKMHEKAGKLAYLLRHGARITNVTVKWQRSRWHISITTRVAPELWNKYHLLRTKKDKKRIGAADLGITKALVYADGTVIENPRSYEKALKKLRKLSKEVSRRRGVNKETGEASSNRYERSVKKLNKQYTKIANQERDFAHKQSKALVDALSIIGLETLNMAGMLKNGRLARHIAHAGWGRFVELVRYKAEWYGSEVVRVDRFFPSSKTCSSCGEVKAKLSLNERVYRCEHCGLVIDRDLNAALNILQYVAQSCGETLNGRGGGSSGSGLDSSGTTTSEASSSGDDSLGQPDMG